ncbi:MAG: ABC transporter substrate-binding protein [Deltaproteobacteria bacterium]|nr:ABC transporter substrate-binding protein [Deltaproteobacteria bacterium]
MLIVRTRFAICSVLGIGAVFIGTVGGLHLYKKPKIYTKPVVDSVYSLNPRNTRTRLDYMTARAILGQFLQYNDFGEIVPSVFESWRIEDNGRKYIFKIRKNVRFHSGKLFSVDDAIFTLHYLAVPSSLVASFFSDIAGCNSFIEGKAKDISGIRALDKESFQITLRRSSYVFLTMLADPKILIVPDRLNGLSEAEFFKKPDGVGPYFLDEILQEGKRLILKRNPHYFGGMPAIHQYVLQTMEKEQAKEAFTKGKVDDLEMFMLTDEESKVLKDVGPSYSTSSYSTAFAFLNGRNRAFHSLPVRKLMKSAVDAKDIRAHCRIPIVESSGIIPQGVMGWINPKYQESNTADPKPVQSAKEYLQRIGKKTIEIMYYGEENDQCSIHRLGNTLEHALEIKVRYSHLSIEEAIKRFSNAHYDILIDNLSLRGREPAHLFTFFDPASPHNLTHFTDKNITRMLEKIHANPIRGLRTVQYMELNRYISEEMVYVLPLFSDIRHFAFSKRVKSETAPMTIMGYVGFERISL